MTRTVAGQSSGHAYYTPMSHSVGAHHTARTRLTTVFMNVWFLLPVPVNVQAYGKVCRNRVQPCPPSTPYPECVS
jgi:hypothetical protein